MGYQRYFVICLAALFVASIIVSAASAQSGVKRKPDFADEVDTAFSRAAKEHNRQKFFTILIYIVLGGACTYATMRGIKKIVSKD